MGVPNNVLDVFKTDIAAQEVLYSMWNSATLVNLVHRDFSPQIQEYGDSVSVKKPADLNTVRKSSTEDVTIQAASASKITVPLDQHAHVSFMLADSDLSKSQEDLISTYLVPAGRSLINTIDASIGAQALRFANKVGQIGTALNSASLLSAGAMLDYANAPTTGRNLWLNPTAYAQLVGDDKFVKANEVGDGGAAMRSALLGERFGFNCYKSNFLPKVGSTVLTPAVNVNTSAASAAGATSLTFASGAASFTVGAPILVGDEIAIVATSAATAVTVTTALVRAHASGTAVKQFGTLTTATTAAAGTNPGVAVSGALVTSAFPCVGTALYIDGSKYAVVSRNGNTIYLDRSFDAALTATSVIYVLPEANYSLACIPQAIGFISRPLITVPTGYGATQNVVSDPATGLSVRTSMQYDGKAQGILVTIDVLYGLTVFESNAAVAILS